MVAAQAVSAVNRFGLGAKPGELVNLGDPREWLLAQLRHDKSTPAFAGLPDSLQYLRLENDYRRERTAARKANKAMPGQDTFAQRFRDAQMQELARRYRLAVSTDAGFFERLVRFWSNHFAVSVDKRTSALYAAPMEREAIRPHVLGGFSDLLIAVEQHPAMLRYLDNVRSVGEQSRFAQRARERAMRRADDAPARRAGLNENLAREILELHTLGVNGGYTQADVTELAKAITGWSLPVQQDWERGRATSAFVFRAGAHEGGTRSVVGKHYAETGEAQGRTILQDLAHHPSTARHLSYKLARHFVGDAPPPALVERLAKTWQREEGDLRAVYRTLIGSDEAWSPDARKFKTPDDFVVSAMRATGTIPNERPRALLQLLTRMGQPPFNPGSPAGFADAADGWSGPDAVWKRIQAAQALAETAPGAQPDPIATAAAVFGEHLDDATASALRRAESPREGLALLFASPAFQWRT
ncbi:DUF1800 family protein [Pseudoxanthomonas sp. UTMC 1351]|uniref:DUF1800 family protein n=1 Tax=Pseudoxanthomonas sp. UTMC 1351 TaxID=2695853 RepID=UPI0034CD78F1